MIANAEPRRRVGKSPKDEKAQHVALMISRYWNGARMPAGARQERPSRQAGADRRHGRRRLASAIHLRRPGRVQHRRCRSVAPPGMATGQHREREGDRPRTAWRPRPRPGGSGSASGSRRSRSPPPAAESAGSPNTCQAGLDHHQRAGEADQDRRDPAPADRLPQEQRETSGSGSAVRRRRSRSRRPAAATPGSRRTAASSRRSARRGRHGCRAAAAPPAGPAAKQRQQPGNRVWKKNQAPGDPAPGPWSPPAAWPARQIGRAPAAWRRPSAACPSPHEERAAGRGNGRRRRGGRVRAAAAAGSGRRRTPVCEDGGADMTQKTCHRLADPATPLFAGAGERRACVLAAPMPAGRKSPVADA